MKKNTLAQDFEARKDAYTNRASALFPIFFKSFENDLIISFMNYWSIKNKIPKEDIIIISAIIRACLDKFLGFTMI